MGRPSTDQVIQVNAGRVGHLFMVIAHTGKYDVIKEGVRLKIEQNTGFRHKLLSDRATTIYEGTYSKLYGCGSTVRDAHQGNFKPNPLFGNRMSKIYKELIGEFSQ